ncbi:hypothetical protein Agub_g11220 [Astrephomene gubernaculifera]|uniref:Uncharacterized protein n=1 Tax=Astrephomene gubernaculifera TaxID=47775 RepID=A0AAD3DW49_9CHLO|nr:hypothetical protein Agub_g11220 [Astrephomene gubernaculifera]
MTSQNSTSAMHIRPQLHDPQADGSIIRAVEQVCPHCQADYSTHNEPNFNSHIEACARKSAKRAKKPSGLWRCPVPGCKKALPLNNAYNIAEHERACRAAHGPASISNTPNIMSYFKRSKRPRLEGNTPEMATSQPHKVPDAEKRLRADFLIDTATDLAATRAQVGQLVARLGGSSSKGSGSGGKM